MNESNPYPHPKDLFERSDSYADKTLRELYPDEPPAIERRIDRAKAVVYIIDRGGHKEVLRLNKKDADYSVHNIAAAYRSWEGIGIPVPHIISTGEQDEMQYMLMSYITEPPFSFNDPEPSQIKTAGQMGAMLARMRQVSVQGYGRLDANGNDKAQNWIDFVKDYYPHDWLYEHGHLTATENKKLHHVKDGRGFPSVDPVLLHGDYKPKNAFVAQDGTVTAMTDPKPIAGDPLWDFAIFNHFVYRGQARRKKPYDEPFFKEMRGAFRDSYVAELGRDLTTDEQDRLLRHEIIIDIGKVEKLKRGKMDEVEGESDLILDYARHKLKEFDS